jgi:transcriptional regulator with XRE-family HTH domain
MSLTKAEQFKRTVAKNLANARAAAQLSQSEAGKKLGMSAQQISHYEHASHVPTCSRLRDMCKVYGVTADSVLGM